MMFPKKTVTIILVVVLIAGILLYSQAAAHVDGTPEATITVRISEADGDGYMSGSINTDMSFTQSIFGKSAPMTTYTANLIGIEPNAFYTIEFIITIQADPPADAPADLILYTDTRMSGVNVAENIFFWSTSQGTGELHLDDITTSPPDYILTADYTMANGNMNWDKVKAIGQSGIYDLKGQYIIGSEWTLVMTSKSAWAGTDAFYGTTTATIVLNADGDGNVTITVTDVDMTATQTG